MTDPVVKPPAKFLVPLYLQDQGGGLFIVERAFSFYSNELDLIVVAPAGYVTDLASIPPYVPGVLMPKLGDWDYPAVIHDAAYNGVLADVTGRKLRISKSQADGLFREGLKARGVGRVRRNLMYLAVHLFGRGTAWNGKGAAE